MNRQFGALSGLAILLVVLNHSIRLGLDYPQMWGFPPLPDWEISILSVLLALGAFAVPTFLFISGGFVAYAVQGEKARLSGKFLASTMRHILLPYLFWSIVFYMLVYVFFQQSSSLLGYIKKLIVGDPYFFVPLLVFYYLISPLLVIIGRRFGLLLVIGIVIYQLVLLNIVYPGIFGFTFPTPVGYLAPPVLRTTMADWGVYFPMGLVYGLHAKRVLPWLRRFVWVFVALTVLIFGIGLLDAFSVVHAPWAPFICPITLMFVLPVIKRDAIPQIRLFERVGKRSYGIYLTHLIVLNLVLFGMHALTPWLLNIAILYFPVLFILASAIPLWAMEGVARGRTKLVYRYIFG
jgi:peptidoglycan/LPS O-acetylase OafA/YrhL